MKEFNKQPSIDCTNDSEMVREGIRVPKYISPVIERNNSDVLKRAKSDYKFSKSFRAESHKDKVNDILKVMIDAILGSSLPRWGNLILKT